MTARGQLTLRKEVLKRLGVCPGDKIQLDLLPNRRAELIAESQKESLRDLRGLLKDRTNGRRLSIGSFDRKAVLLMAEQGRQAKLLA